MKYIIAQINGEEHPIVFPYAITHSILAQLLRSQIGKVVSAGFVSYDSHGEVSCHGLSTSLGIKSRPQDSDILKKEITSGARES